MHTKDEKLQAFGRLLDVLDELRVKCPWDAKQTNESLRPNSIEEVHELSQAILDGDSKGIMKELGDVLLHVAFYSKIGEEKGDFDLKDVCDAITDKLIFRHPHVFGDTSVTTSEEVERNWEQIKLKEKDGNKTVMGGVPRGLPPMIKAYRIQEKATNVGFDWEHKEDVWAKVEEELSELRAEVMADSPTERKEAELGDFLFSLINMGRLYGLEADTALERTNAKFIRRFTYIEEQAKASGRALKSLTLEEMDHYWNEAKHLDL